MSIEDDRLIQMEGALRSWISATAPCPNLLSRLKARRNTELLLKCNALTNLPAAESLKGLEDLVRGGQA